MKNAVGKRTTNSEGVSRKGTWASGSVLQISIHINTDSWSRMQPSPEDCELSSSLGDCSTNKSRNHDKRYRSRYYLTPSNSGTCRQSSKKKLGTNKSCRLLCCRKADYTWVLSFIHKVVLIAKTGCSLSRFWKSKIRPLINHFTLVRLSGCRTPNLSCDLVSTA